MHGKITRYFAATWNRNTCGAVSCSDAAQPASDAKRELFGTSQRGFDARGAGRCSRCWWRSVPLHDAVTNMARASGARNPGSRRSVRRFRGPALDLSRSTEATVGPSQAAIAIFHRENVSSSLDDDRTSPGSQDRPGAGGLRRLRFRAAAAGSATIELAYARRAPANAKAAKRFVLRVRVLS
jgi:hypothetical protein